MKNIVLDKYKTQAMDQIKIQYKKCSSIKPSLNSLVPVLALETMFHRHFQKKERNRDKHFIQTRRYGKFMNIQKLIKNSLR